MDPNITKEEYIEMYRNKLIETSPVIKSNFVKIFTNDPDKKLIGHICVICETIFKGNIGGSQRQHKCVKKSLQFSSSQKETAKNAALQMINTDLTTFNTVRKEGFIGFTKEMLKLGAELGIGGTKNLTYDLVKDLLPHPTTLSNHINNIASKKEEFYAYLRKETENSGVALMIDGTSKSFHYTGIVLTYIDQNWQLKKVLCDLIADAEKGGQAAEYAVVKVEEFLNAFGISIEFLNAIISDEAAPMKAAFQKSKAHIICSCHVMSTVSKHTCELYAGDKKKYPELEKLLERIRALLQKLKEVVTILRGRIYIREKLISSIHQSNITRWLSSLTSIESFLDLHEKDHALIRKELENHASYGKYLDVVQAKDDLKCIFDVLHPTRHLLRSFEADKSPTLHLVVPGFYELYEHFCNAVDQNSWIERSMKTAGKYAIQEKVPLLHDYHYFAVILDPNAKFEIAKFILPDRKGNKKLLPDILQGLRTAVYDYAVSSGKYQLPQDAVDNDSPFAAYIEAPEDDFKRTIDAEVNRYLLDKDTYTTTLLGYWKNALNYPYLSYYAKFLFSIPASSSPLERSFNVLNKVDNDERPQLSQETISNIIISNAIEKFCKTII